MDASPPKIELGLDDGAMHTGASRALPLVQLAAPSLLSSSRPDALQALLAFSFFHQQVRRSRLQKQYSRGAPSGLASDSLSEDFAEEEKFLFDDVLQLVADRARAITGADGVAIALAEGDGIICRASSGAIAPDPGVRLDPRSAFSGACLRTGKIVRCDDVENDSRVNLQACLRLGTRAVVAVPLCGQCSVVGLLEAFSRDAHSFNESDVRSLSLLGELILAALRPEQEERLSEVASAAIFDTTESHRTAATVLAPKPPVDIPEPDAERVEVKVFRKTPEFPYFGEYEKTVPSRPGMLVVTAAIIVAALFAGGLGWKMWNKRANANNIATLDPVKAAIATSAQLVTSDAKADAQSPEENLDADQLSTAPSDDDVPKAHAGDAKTTVLPLVTDVRHWSSFDASTVAIDLGDQVQYEAHRLSSPERIYFDLHDTKLASNLSGKIIEVGDGLLTRVRVAQPMASVTRVVLETKGGSNFSVSLEPNPYRLVVQVRGQHSTQDETQAKVNLFPALSEPQKTKFVAPVPSASREDMQLRAHVPKFRIVLDAGHGGWDLGTVGRRGLLEKDVVLEIAQRLGRLLERRLGSEVIFTRKDDAYIPLDQRADLANQTQADLFVSIHANYSDLASARGVETYYTNLFSAPGSREIEKRENAGMNKPVMPVSLSSLELRDKVEESRRLAASVQRALYDTLAAQSPTIRDRGVKEASFVVLRGTAMPSILAEVSFVSSPTDEQNLESSIYRQQIAEALYKGIARYAAAPHRVKMASTSAKSTGE